MKKTKKWYYCKRCGIPAESRKQLWLHMSIKHRRTEMSLISKVKREVASKIYGELCYTDIEILPDGRFVYYKGDVDKILDKYINTKKGK